MPDPDFNAFKNCCRIQGNLELESWDMVLFQPLKDMHKWWITQSAAVQSFTAAIGGLNIAAFTRWVGRVAGIVSAEVAGLFAEALTAVMAGLALAAFMDIVGRCLGHVVPNV